MIRLEDVLKTFLQDVLKAPSEDEVERRPQDVLKTSSLRRMLVCVTKVVNHGNWSVSNFNHNDTDIKLSLKKHCTFMSDLGGTLS